MFWIPTSPTMTLMPRNTACWAKLIIKLAQSQCIRGKRLTTVRFHRHTLRPSKPISENCMLVNSSSKWCRSEDLFAGHKSIHEQSEKCGYLLALSLLGLFGLEEEVNKEPEIITQIKYGILSMQRGELEKAEQLLHIALKTAQETQNDLGITYIYDLLANVALQQNQFEKAEKLFVSVLKRLLAEGTADDHNSVVEVSLKLASIYVSLGNTEKAISGFHFCLSTQEAKIKESGLDNLDNDTLLLWAMSMDWYGRFLLSLKRYGEAKENFQKALEMSCRINGENHEQTAVLLNDLGSVSCLEGKFDEALDFLSRAIDTARSTDSPDIATFYVNMGSVFLQKGLKKQAESHCQDGLKLARKMENAEAQVEANSCLERIKEWIKENETVG